MATQPTAPPSAKSTPPAPAAKPAAPAAPQAAPPERPALPVKPEAPPRQAEVGKDAVYDSLYESNPALANEYLKHLNASTPAADLKAQQDAAAASKLAEEKAATDSKATDAEKKPDGEKAVEAAKGTVTVADFDRLEAEYFASPESKISEETRKALKDRGYDEEIVARLEENLAGKKERNGLLIERVFGSLDDYEKAKQWGEDPRNMNPSTWKYVVEGLKDKKRENVEAAAHVLRNAVMASGGKLNAGAAAPEVRTGTAPAAPGGDEFKNDHEASEFYRKEILAKGLQSGAGETAKKAFAEFDRRSMGLLRSPRAR